MTEELASLENTLTQAILDTYTDVGFRARQCESLAFAPNPDMCELEQLFRSTLSVKFTTYTVNF